MNELIDNDRILTTNNKHLVRRSKKKNKSYNLKISKKNKKYSLKPEQLGGNPLKNFIQLTSGVIDMVKPFKETAEFFTGANLSPLNIAKKTLFGSSKPSEKAICDSVPLISGQNIELKSNNDTVLNSMYRKIFGNKPEVNPNLSELSTEQKKTADGVVATFLKPALTGILASGGYVVNNPVASATIASLALKLASDPKLSQPILSLMNEAKNGFKSSAGNLADEANSLLTDGLLKVGNLGAQSYMGFRNYFDNLNIDSVLNGPVDSVILNKYKNDITKAYKILQGYDKEKDKAILEQEREIIDSGYKQFSELQWLAAVSDIETEIHKPKYDKEEDNEFKKQLYIKMVAAFCNKTAQLGLNNFELSFKNEVIFSHDPCDFKLFEHLGQLLQMIQYNMLFSIDNLSSKNILEISNLPMKVFSYKLWYLCCIHTNYNPYNGIENLTLWKILPTFVMENLNFFRDFYTLIDSQKVDETITDMINKCGYAVDLDKKNPIIAGLRKRDFFDKYSPLRNATKAVQIENERRQSKKASKAVMKFVFETSNVIINYIILLKLNDWNLIVSLCYSLKCSIYIYMFVFFRVQQINNDTLPIPKRTEWLNIIQEGSKPKISTTTYIKFCKQLLWLSKINQVLEQEGIKVTENYDIESKKDILGGKMILRKKMRNKSLNKNIQIGAALATAASTAEIIDSSISDSNLVPSVPIALPIYEVNQEVNQEVVKGIPIPISDDQDASNDHQDGGNESKEDFIFSSVIETYNKNNYKSISLYEPISIGEYCIIFPGEENLINKEYTSELVSKIYELLKLDSGYRYLTNNINKFFEERNKDYIAQLTLRIETLKKQVLDGINELESIQKSEYSDNDESVSSLITLNLVKCFNNIIEPLKNIGKTIKKSLVKALTSEEDRKLKENYINNNYEDQLQSFIEKFSEDISLLGTSNHDQRKRMIEDIIKHKDQIIAKIAEYKAYLNVAKESAQKSKTELQANQGQLTENLLDDTYLNLNSKIKVLDDTVSQIDQQITSLDELNNIISPFNENTLDQIKNRKIFSLLQTNKSYESLINERDKMFKKTVDFGRIYASNNQENYGLPISDSYDVLVWMQDGTSQLVNIEKERIYVLYPDPNNNGIPSNRNFYQESIWIPSLFLDKAKEAGGMEIQKFLDFQGRDISKILNELDKTILKNNPELQRLITEKKTQEAIAKLQELKSFDEATKINLDGIKFSDYLKAANGVTDTEGKLTKGATNLYKYTQLVNTESFDPSKYWYYQYNGDNGKYKLKYDITASDDEDVVYSIVKVTDAKSTYLYYPLCKCDTLVFLKGDSDDSQIPDKESIMNLSCHGIISYEMTQKNDSIKSIQKSGDLQLADLLHDSADHKVLSPDEGLSEDTIEEFIKDLELCSFGSQNTAYDYSKFFDLFKTINIIGKDKYQDQPNFRISEIINILSESAKGLYKKSGGGSSSSPQPNDHIVDDSELKEVITRTEIRKNECSDEILLKLPVNLILTIISKITSISAEIAGNIKDMLSKILNVIFSTGKLFTIAISGEIVSLFNLSGINLSNTWSNITDQIKDNHGFLAGIISYIVSLIKTILDNIKETFSDLINYYFKASTKKEDKESDSLSNAVNIEVDKGGQRGGKVNDQYGQNVQIQIWKSLVLLSTFMNRFIKSKKSIDEATNKLNQNGDENPNNEELNKQIIENKKYEQEYLQYIQHIYKQIMDKRQKLKINTENSNTTYSINSDQEEDENDVILNFTKSEEINQQIAELEGKINDLREENNNLQTVLHNLKSITDDKNQNISNDQDIEKQLFISKLKSEPIASKIYGGDNKLKKQNLIERIEGIIQNNEQAMKRYHQNILDNQSKMNTPLFENYIRGSKADRQLYAARNIDPLIEPGFIELSQADNTSMTNSIRQSLKVTVPNQIFESSSHLDRVRAHSSNLLRSNSVPRGNKPYTIMFSMVMMASQNRKKNQSFKNVDFEEEYNTKDKIEILEQQESRGFRSIKWSIIANSIGNVQNAGGIVKNLQSEALNQVLGVGLGQTGIAKTVNKYVIDKISDVANKAINLSRSNFYFPVLENVFGQIEKISSNEYLIRIINENNIFFADFENTITKPIIKVTLIGNQAIYRYVTVNLNTQNPAIKKKQEGMQVYYIGNENNVRLPFEPNNVDVDYLECEILFYPLRLADLVKKSQEYKSFDKRIWTPIFNQIAGNFDPSFEDLQINSLGSQVLENVNLNILQILSKPSINIIKDNRNSLSGESSISSNKTLVRKMDLLNKLILESIYTYHTSNIFGEILLFLTYNINNNFSEKDKQENIYSKERYKSMSSLVLCLKESDDDHYNEIFMLKGNCFIVSRIKKNNSSKFLRDVSGNNQKQSDKEIEQLFNKYKTLKQLNESGVLYVYYYYKNKKLENQTTNDFIESTAKFFCLEENDTINLTQIFQSENDSLQRDLDKNFKNDDVKKLNFIRKMANIVSNSSVQNKINKDAKQQGNALEDYKFKIFTEFQQDVDTFIINSQNLEQNGGDGVIETVKNLFSFKRKETKVSTPSNQDDEHKKTEDKKFEELSKGSPVALYKLGHDDQISNSETIYSIHWVEFTGPNKPTIKIDQKDVKIDRKEKADFAIVLSNPDKPKQTFYLKNTDLVIGEKKDWKDKIYLCGKDNSMYMLCNYLDKISKLDKKPEGYFNL